MKLLLVEDDTKLAEHLSESLKDHGFFVTHIANQHDLIEVLQAPLKIDFILLDRLLGTFDTKTQLPAIRKKWPAVPLIVLSAISTPNERTDLLDLGVDDYVGKPFATHELVARMRALRRRSSVPVGNYLQVGNLIIDSIKHVISVGDKAEILPTREFALLRTLAQDPSRIWSKDELLDYVWGQSSSVDTNVVESTVTNVRKKLQLLGSNAVIRNMRNAGYWIAQ